MEINRNTFANVSTLGELRSIINIIEHHNGEEVPNGLCLTTSKFFSFMEEYYSIPNIGADKAVITLIKEYGIDKKNESINYMNLYSRLRLYVEKCSICEEHTYDLCLKLNSRDAKRNKRAGIVKDLEFGTCEKCFDEELCKFLL